MIDTARASFMINLVKPIVVNQVEFTANITDFSSLGLATVTFSRPAYMYEGMPTLNSSVVQVRILSEDKLFVDSNLLRPRRKLQEFTD